MSSDLVASPDPDYEGGILISRSGRKIVSTAPQVHFNPNPRKRQVGLTGFLNQVYPLGNWTLTWRKA